MSRGDGGPDHACGRASFARNGWAGTTIRGVARDAGVDPALVHYYFSSKEELLDASTMPPEPWIAPVHRTSLVPLRERGRGDRLQPDLGLGTAGDPRGPERSWRPAVAERWTMTSGP
jgi:Bacterial regulatory proteins, tetR family